MKTLLPDQQDAIDFAYERDYSLLRLPTGFGKTIVALTVIQELIKNRVLDRVLVLAPLRVIQSTWRDEPHDWDHINLDVRLAIGSPGERLNALDSGSDIVVMNYENVAWFANEMGTSHNFDGIVFDELTKLKSVSGTQFKKLRRMYASFEWRCGMAAGSDNDGLEDLYGQMMMLDNGAALGRRKDKFMQRWFNPVGFPTNVFQQQWEPKPESAKEIAKIIAPCVYSPDPTAYEDTLPALSVAYHGVVMPIAAIAVYKEMEYKSVVKAHDIKAVNAAVVSGKLQQVCSGFMYDEDDVIRLHREKQKMVRKLVFEINLRDPGPILISYWFDEELAQLQELFPDAPVMGKGDMAEQVRAWNTGTVPVMLVHPKSGGHGINIQYGGHTLIMFGPIWSNDLTHQLISRLRRRGQTHDVNVHVIVVDDTLEVSLMIPRVEGKKSDAALFSGYLRSIG